MPTLELYNENAFRTEPFREGAYTFGGIGLPHDFIVDAAVVLLQVETDIELKSLTRTSDGKIYLLFQGVEKPEIQFMAHAVTDKSAARVNTEAGSLHVVFEEVASFLAALPVDSELTSDVPCILRPTKSITVPPPVTGVRLAAERDAVVAECDEIPQRGHFIQTSPLYREGLDLLAGYNASIERRPAQNQIVIGIRRGAGDEFCDRPELEEHGDEGPIGSSLPDDDALACRDMLYTIAGVPPLEDGTFRLTGSSGVSVLNFPDEHTVVIDFTRASFIFGLPIATRFLNFADEPIIVDRDDFETEDFDEWLDDTLGVASTDDGTTFLVFKSPENIYFVEVTESGSPVGDIEDWAVNTMGVLVSLDNRAFFAYKTASTVYYVEASRDLSGPTVGWQEGTIGIWIKEPYEIYAACRTNIGSFFVQVTPVTDIAEMPDHLRGPMGYFTHTF